MYIFEFTDKEIRIYNKKKNQLYIETIPPNLIVNNKIYDYLQLVNLFTKILNKYKILNSIFRIKIKILIFENMSPSDIYLFKNLFKVISNVSIEIISVYSYFNDKTIFISGDKIYYKNKLLKNIEEGIFTLVGISEDFELVKERLEKKHKIKIFEYENNDTIIYEKV